MPNRTWSPRPTSHSGSGNTAQKRFTATRRGRRRRIRWAIAVVAAAIVAASVTGAALLGSGSNRSSAAFAEVGEDLHTVFVLGDALYVGGHDAVGVSRDGGRSFQAVPSLAGADVMGWASSGSAVLVGGHPGLYRSTDRGATFTRATGAGAVPDVHALGGAGDTLYLASPQAGLLVSTDAGVTWQVRNAQAGRSFMGTILVDPGNTARLIAADMSVGLTTSRDGGRTWTVLGGPSGVMAVAWKPGDTGQLVAVGMDGGALSSDGGTTWRPVSLPPGTSAVAYDPTGGTLYAGVLNGGRARLYRSVDGANTWSLTG